MPCYTLFKIHVEFNATARKVRKMQITYMFLIGQRQLQLSDTYTLLDTYILTLAPISSMSVSVFTMAVVSPWACVPPQ